jgi:aminopeptidase N
LQGLRSYTLDLIGEDSALLSIQPPIQTIEMMAKTDSDRKTKAKGTGSIGLPQWTAKYEPLFTQYINDSSYSIAGAALMGLNNLNGVNALSIAKKMAPGAKGKIR